MKRIPAVIGIDTSNYCTSLALLGFTGQLLADERIWLPVPEGERGMQQSEAVFHHVTHLPRLFIRIDFSQILVKGIGVSTAPRPVEGSYMPVFRVGTSWATSLAQVLNVPLIETTHQEGHLAAGEMSTSPPLTANQFLAVHLSGGTTELLSVQRMPTGYKIERIGGTTDLNAGQLVDRIGVALGLSFPAGAELEKLVQRSPEGSSFAVPSAVKGLECSFSGPYTALMRALKEEKVSTSTLAFAVFRCIANTLEKILRNAFAKGYPREVLIVGGVAANQLIRQRLRERLEHHSVGGTLYFAEPRLSGDNAVGVARLTLRQVE